jgi:hypothetical protein
MSKKINIFYIILFFLGLPFFLEAQTANSNEKNRSVRLTWPKDENAWSYEVLIEVQNRLVYKSYSKEVTKNSFIVVSLPPGKYRYRIIPYNFLGQPEINQSSAWMRFEIPAASSKSDGTYEPIFLPDFGSLAAQLKPGESTAVPANQWTVGVSLGTSFYRPWVITTLHATYAPPLPNSFLEAGIDIGVISRDVGANYFSLYPFVHYNYSKPLPFFEKIGWYIGGGGGYWVGNYSASGETAQDKKIIIGLTAGINIINIIDVSYTLRTDFKGANHKLSAGYVYRFPNQTAVNKEQGKENSK